MTGMHPEFRPLWHNVSLVSLFISIALVGLGITSLTWIGKLYTVFPHNNWTELIPPLLWICGGGLIGAGLLRPFDKAGWGALIGGVFQLALLVVSFVLVVMAD